MFLTGKNSFFDLFYKELYEPCNFIENMFDLLKNSIEDKLFFNILGLHDILAVFLNFFPSRIIKIKIYFFC